VVDRQVSFTTRFQTSIAFALTEMEQIEQCSMAFEECLQRSPGGDETRKAYDEMQVKTSRARVRLQIAGLNEEQEDGVVDLSSEAARNSIWEKFGCSAKRWAGSHGCNCADALTYSEYWGSRLNEVVVDRTILQPELGIDMHVLEAPYHMLSCVSQGLFTDEAEFEGREWATRKFVRTRPY